MDNGASSYRRFLEGDDEGIVEIIRDYKDGLILFFESLCQQHTYSRRISRGYFFQNCHQKATVHSKRFLQNMAIYDWPEYGNNSHQAHQENFGYSH